MSGFTSRNLHLCSICTTASGAVERKSLQTLSTLDSWCCEEGERVGVVVEKEHRCCGSTWRTTQVFKIHGLRCHWVLTDVGTTLNVRLKQNVRYWGSATDPTWLAHLTQMKASNGPQKVRRKS